MNLRMCSLMSKWRRVLEMYLNSWWRVALLSEVLARNQVDRLPTVIIKTTVKPIACAAHQIDGTPTLMGPIGF